jgi:hypothetical protein
VTRARPPSRCSAEAREPPGGPSRADRQRCYGPEVAAAAAVLWQAAGRIGPHRLHPFVPDFLERLVQGQELDLAPPGRETTAAGQRPRLAQPLTPARAQYPRRGSTTTRPGTGLQQ